MSFDSFDYDPKVKLDIEKCHEISLVFSLSSLNIKFSALVSASSRHVLS